MAETSRQRESMRRYHVEFGVSMAAYVVAVFAAAWWVNRSPDVWWRYLAALLPMVPLLGGAWALVRLNRRSDELHRLMRLESLAFAFTVTAIATLTYGFLETAGLPRLSAWWYWSLLATSWFVGHQFSHWRRR